jgi:pSer/pThr/pTyr-binding forkhead associated (FHA) protein
MGTMNTRPHFYVLSGPEVGRDFTCADGDILGRAATCAVSLKGNALSRNHARVEREGDGWVLADLGSRNGLLQGDVRVLRARLVDGMEITLGDVRLRVRLKPEDDRGVGEGDVVFEAGPAEAQKPRTPAPPDPSPGSQASDGLDEIILDESGDASAPPTAQAAPASPAPARRTTENPVARPSARARAGLLPATPDTGGRPILQYSQVPGRRGFLGSDLAQHPLWVRWLVGLGAAAGSAGFFYLVFRLVKTLRGAA